MKSDFLVALTQLAAEKNLPQAVVLQAVEAALASAYKKDHTTAGLNISVRIHPQTGEVKVYMEKVVVEKPTDPRREISLDEAHKIKKGVALGEVVPVETTTTPQYAGRIAAQLARQVVLQRLREAEREVVFEEYAGKEGDIVSGVIQRAEPKQVIIDLGRTEAVLPLAEQVRTEHYRVGNRMKFYVLGVSRAGKGPQVGLSRSHPNLTRRLFELEVPEVFNGTVEIKAIAREAGFRSKVAVAARQAGIDPVGSCVGLRGIRIQNIVNEVGGEKIDVILWDPNPAVFVAHALSPAQVVEVTVDEASKSASVVVPDHQLSLAIGKEGQNARLAARLTGWRIDIKSATAAEAEKAAQMASLAVKEEAPVAPPPAPAPAAPEVPPAPEIAAQPGEVKAGGVPAAGPIAPTAPPAPTREEVPVAALAPEMPAVTEKAEAEPSSEVEETVEVVAVPEVLLRPRGQIRFAEDFFIPELMKGKGKKGKKRPARPEKKEEAGRPKKGVRARVLPGGEGAGAAE